MSAIHQEVSTEGPSAKCPMKINEIHSTTPRLNKEKLRLRGANWRREWQPLQYSHGHGESHGQRSLAGHRPWAHKESDTTERLSVHAQRGQVTCPKP